MDKICFLFGRCGASKEVQAGLEQALLRRISAGVRVFALGYGTFEQSAAETVGMLKRRYPEVRLLRLAACCPPEEVPLPQTDTDGVLHPFGAEEVPKRFQETYANRWMVQNCDSVICYVNQTGNAQILLSIARRRGIPVENLAEEG